MTTEVKVTAHCADTKQVNVNVKFANGEENSVLQDGETMDFYTYDDRVISVSEVEKEVDGS